MKNPAFSLLLLAATCLGPVAALHAVTYTWDGTADTTWSGSNWNNGTAGQPWADGNAAVISSAATIGIDAANVAPASVVVSNGSGAVVISGAFGITDSGSATTFAMNGAGTLTVSSINSYTGGTTVTAGTVTVSNDQTAANGGWTIGPQSTATTTVNFDASSKIAVAYGKSISVGRLDAVAGTLVQTLNAAGIVTNAGTLKVGRAGIVNVNSGAAWTQSGDITLGGQGGYTAALNVNTGSTFTYSGTDPIALIGGSSGNATLAIGGTFLTGSAFSLTGGTSTGISSLSLAGGTIRLTSNVASLITSTAGIGGTGTNVFSVGVGGGTIDTNGFNTTLAYKLTGTTAFTKAGLGTLTVSTAGAVTGATTVSGGTLAAGAINAFSPGSATTVSTGATLDLAGFSNSLVSLAGAGAVTNSGATDATITFTGGATFTGSLTDGPTNKLAVTKATGGTQTLGGTSTYKTGYTGATTVTAGTLSFGAASSGGGIGGASGGVFTVNGGTLQFSSYGTSALTVSTFATATGAGTGITINSGGTLNLYQYLNTGGTGTWTLPAVTLNTGGTLKFQSGFGNSTFAFASAIASSGTTTFAGASNYAGAVSLTGILSGSGQINYTITSVSNGSAQTLKLTNASNSYTGNWVVTDSSAKSGDTAALISGAVGALGTGTVTLSTSAILTSSIANGLNSLAGVTLNTATSTLNTANFTWQNTNAAVSMTAGTFNVGSGTVQIGSLNGVAGTVQASATASRIQVGSGAFAGVMADNGTNILGLTKYGSGTLTISGVNTYTGTTTVSGGTLLVNGSLGASAVSVASGAVLGGTGTLNGAVSVASGGFLQGGDGTLGTITTHAGAVTLASGSIVQLALGSSGAHSSLALTGATTFDGAQKFTFIDLGITTGTYASLITGLSASVDTSAWSITNAGYAGSFVYNGGNIDLVLTAVPEPSAYGLMGAGALALAACVRRRAKRVV